MTARPFLIAASSLLVSVLAACSLTSPDATREGNDRGGSGKYDDPVPAFRASLSLSPFSGLLTSAGFTFSDGETTATSRQELITLYGEHGATEVFVRIATQMEPGEGADHSLATALDVASIAAGRRMPLNVELGLFRSYGDVRCQTPPDFAGLPIVVAGPWHTLTLEQMMAALSDYGEEIASRIMATGVTVNVWDIGNEVDFGVAGVAPRPHADSTCDEEEGTTDWYRPPDGIDPAIGEQSFLALVQMPEGERVAWLEQHLWPHEGRLLAAVADGIRRVVPDARFSTHIATGDSPGFALAFYRAMAEAGFSVDQAGVSLYPSAKSDADIHMHGFVDTVTAISEELGLKVFVAEYAYPGSIPDDDGFFGGFDHELAFYGFTHQGQAQLLEDVVSWGAATGLAGIRPWAPDLVVPGWDFMALFELEAGTLVAQARPGLGSIVRGLEQPAADALILQ